MEDKHRQQAAAFDDVSARISLLEAKTEELEESRQGKRYELLLQMLNTSLICRLHQGQIQDEKATCASSFEDSSLRWDTDVRAYNELILDSFADSTALVQKIAKREKTMKQSRWEIERLQYCVGTLEMELRHLHTLRVTRQMQEWLSGDADVSEEKAIAGIEKHKEFVNRTMKKKLDDLVATAQRLKVQIADRSIENQAIDSQYQQLKGTVEDMGTVKSMVDAHADGSEHHAKRAKEIYETSELEEVARSQQEELYRLKREVDRLRERTFPSFAVVSKRTV
ncbi:hypothetical protein AGDE_02633 [Angomonas deanei]|nr:hypothetical protein AGDE_02633 [Angomonas deanei]|eukprot:EPY41292.1 hypothetical protein AGDE_02633 [Angomonas deanei]